jgi:DNA-binding NarL/FixJ family response regulator
MHLPSEPSTPRTLHRVLIVEDHPLMRQGIGALLQRSGSFEVCGEAENAGRALHLADSLAPELAIVDISLRLSNGLEFTRSLRRIAPSVKVLILSMHCETIFAEQALQAGAKGYLMKDEDPHNLLSAIDHILQGEVFISPRLRDRHHRQATFSPHRAITPRSSLSNREAEVFKLIGEGFSTREIASRLGLSIKTVDTYKEHLKVKLNFSSGAEMLRHAIQRRCVVADA